MNKMYRTRSRINKNVLHVWSVECIKPSHETRENFVGCPTARWSPTLGWRQSSDIATNDCFTLPCPFNWQIRTGQVCETHSLTQNQLMKFWSFSIVSWVLPCTLKVQSEWHTERVHLSTSMWREHKYNQGHVITQMGSSSRRALDTYGIKTPINHAPNVFQDYITILHMAFIHIYFLEVKRASHHKSFFFQVLHLSIWNSYPSYVWLQFSLQIWTSGRFFHHLEKAQQVRFCYPLRSRVGERRSWRPIME